jgi:hypothetical protein
VSSLQKIELMHLQAGIPGLADFQRAGATGVLRGMSVQRLGWQHGGVAAEGRQDS